MYTWLSFQQQTQLPSSEPHRNKQPVARMYLSSTLMMVTEFVEESLATFTLPLTWVALFKCPLGKPNVLNKKRTCNWTQNGTNVVWARCLSRGPTFPFHCSAWVSPLARSATSSLWLMLSFKNVWRSTRARLLSCWDLQNSIKTRLLWLWLTTHFLCSFLATSLRRLSIFSLQTW